MRSQHANVISIKIKIIAEDKFCIFPISTEGEYNKYRASPLYTCFAYLIYYQTKANEINAILYHAKSGIPERLSEIFSEIKENYQSIKEVIIATPKPLTYANTNVILEKGKLLLQDAFGKKIEDIPITIVEDTFLFDADTRGNHGVMIPDPNFTAHRQMVITYLQYLKQDIGQTNFTRYNLFSIEVEGKPTGVKALEECLKHLDDVIALKSTTTPEMLFAAICQEFAAINEREKLRTSVTLGFYARHNTQIEEIQKQLSSNMKSNDDSFTNKKTRIPK